MPNPEDVNHSKFDVKSIVHNKNGFSIAFGIWKNSEQCFACRWNGDENSIGFPNSRGNPVWFMLSNDVAQALILGLTLKGSLNLIDLLKVGQNECN